MFPTPLTILSQDSFRLTIGSAFHLEGPGWSGHPDGICRRPVTVRLAGGRWPRRICRRQRRERGGPSTPAGTPGLVRRVARAAASTAAIGGKQMQQPRPRIDFPVPLVGGSGGGGAGPGTPSCGFRGAGGGGGGGGGALLVAAKNQILLGGRAHSSTHEGGREGIGCERTYGGSGSGGSVRLASTTLAGNRRFTWRHRIVRIEGNASTYSGTSTPFAVPCSPRRSRRSRPGFRRCASRR